MLGSSFLMLKLLIIKLNDQWGTQSSDSVIKPRPRCRAPASSLFRSAQRRPNSRAEWGLGSDVIGERLSPLLTGSAQAWGSARRSVQPCPASNQAHWPLLGKRWFPTSLQMTLKGNVRCQLRCNSQLDREKGMSGCPSGAWRSVGFPRVQWGISFLISAEQGGDRRGLNTGKSHQSPWNSTNVHLTPRAGAWPCFAKSRRWSFLPS